MTPTCNGCTPSRRTPGPARPREARIVATLGAVTHHPHIQGAATRPVVRPLEPSVGADG